jgi:hypothetical protein
MGKTLDFTRRGSDGQLNGISLASAKIPVPQLPKFLQAVNLGNNLRGCYFVDDVPKRDFFYYDLAWMKIPEGFAHVNYKFEVSKDANGAEKIKLNVSTPKAGMTAKMDLLFPLVQLYDKAQVSEESHICNIFAAADVFGNGHPEGCSVPLMAHREEFIDPTTGGQLVKSKKRNFHLFRYEGQLRLNSADTTEAGGAMGVHYLVPFFLSERLVVYYRFDLNDAEAIKELYRSSQPNVYVQIVDPLTINDQKGIFVTTKVAWQR